MMMSSFVLAATIAAAVAAAANTAYSAQQQSEAQDAQADLQKIEAQQAVAVAAAQEQRLRHESAQLRSKQIAAFAASGVTMEGSPLEVMEETAMYSELDALTARYQGAASAWRSTAQARLLRAQAQTTRTAGYIGAGASLLGGAGKAASMYSSPPTISGGSGGNLGSQSAGYNNDRLKN